MVTGLPVPVDASPAGYAALIAKYDLQVPPPDELVAIGSRNTFRSDGSWRVLTPRYRPEDSLAAHTEFALKHEGVNLGVLNAFFQVAPCEFIEEWIRTKPTGRHARRIWFLYEWLTGHQLTLPDVVKANYVDVLDTSQQYAIKGQRVKRYRVRNNLPGTPEFCPLVRCTEILKNIGGQNLAEEAGSILQQTSPDLIARTAAFLLLEDSKASFTIEGENPPQNRLQRWGATIEQAGQRPLDEAMLLSLQELVIGKSRFVNLGWRFEGGFVGTRNRLTNAPTPSHISARAEDIEDLIHGLLVYADQSENGSLDPIAATAAIAFGFVFIHPFEDGNGRIHRWIIHHVLRRQGFSPAGMIFPVSTVLLERIERYRDVLERFSKPRLLLTQWETTASLNVRVVNDTRDLFRFFDATRQAEFLAECVSETVHAALPREINYLCGYDEAKQRIEAFVEMPNAKFDLMLGFLRQNGGRFSRRARTKEFSLLTDEEAQHIETIYEDCLLKFDSRQ